MGFLDSSDTSTTLSIVSQYDSTGTDQASQGMKEISGSADEAGKSASSFSADFTNGMNKVAAVTGVVGAGLSLFAKNSVDKLQDLVKTSKDLSRQTGMTAEDSSALIGAMKQLGFNTDNSSIAIRTFSKVIADSQKDTTDQTNKLNALGVATKNADGSTRDFNSILLDTADAFQKMPDGAQKTSDAVTLFGRQGTEMIKVLNGGSQAITDLEQKAKDLGLTITDQNIGTISDYIKSQKDLANTTQSLQIEIGQLTAPILTGFNSTLNDMLTALIGVNSPTRDLTANVIAFGGPILDASSGVLAFTANIASSIPLFQAFGKLVSTPIVMPAITVAAALASLAAVLGAIQSVIGAINAMNQAADAQKKLQETNAQLTLSAAQAYGAGDRAKGDKLAAIAGKTSTTLPSTGDYISAGIGAVFNPNAWAKSFGFANGGFTGIGGVNEVAGIVHKGEYVLRQDQVNQSTGQPLPNAVPNAPTGASYSISMSIENVNLTSDSAVRGFFTLQDMDSQLIARGITPLRGV